MEFNPLDLLASAAELQQKNDGEKEPIMTRSQLKNTSSRQVTTASLKENKLHNNNNNNNNLKNKELGHILHKIKFKVNPDLEKMLNEHNYGNAKKSAKYERDVDFLIESRAPAPRIDRKGSQSVDDSDSSLDDNEELNRQNCTEADDSFSQCESEVCFTCGGHISLNKESRTDSAFFGASCGCQTNTSSVTGDDGCGGSVEGTCRDCGQPRHESDSGSNMSNGQQTFCECRKGCEQDELADPVCLCNGEDKGTESCDKCKLLQASAEKQELENKTDKNCDVSVSINHDNQQKIVEASVPLVQHPVDNTSTSEKVNTLSETEVTSPDSTATGEKTDTDFAIALQDGESESLTVATDTTLLSGHKQTDTEDTVVPDSQTSTNLSAKFMFERSQKLEKCNFKSFNLDTSLCTDSSVSNVHLLSPDRRNPDSMGVVESPSSNQQQELPCFEDQDTDNGSFIVKDSLTDDEISQDCSTEDSLIGENRLQRKHSGSDKLTHNLTICDNSANDSVLKVKNNFPVFRFDSDHCYAGLPEKINECKLQVQVDEEVSLPSKSEEVSTPLSSGGGYLSQDSGYEDVSQSPDGLLSMPITKINPNLTVLRRESLSTVNSEKQVLSSLVPVLLSVNSNGSLTVRNSNMSNNIHQNVFAVTDNSPTESGLKLMSGSNLTTLSQTPILLSPVGKTISPVSVPEPSKETSAAASSEASVADMSSELAAHLTSPLKLSTSLQQGSPPKYGKFRIGTFASFSNTGMDEKVKFSSSPWTDGLNSPVTESPLLENHLKSPSANSYLGSLVQKVKSNLLPLPLPNPQILDNKTDHIQHDHDYCMKNLMPSVVSSSLENKLLKENLKLKTGHGKGRKQILEDKSEGKTFKRKRGGPYPYKDELEEFEMDDETEVYSSGFARPKTRAEKYIEQKSVEPKVKITGSSNFQDQFVYFMNTKKRSRRRESRDSPTVKPINSPMFVPPKPGDIIVPHLTDQDIDNLKLRSKRQHKNSPISAYNSLRNEFMAAKLSNTTFSSQPSDLATLPAADDEKNIINTILSIEETMAAGAMHAAAESEVPYNESMEMYGQGLGGDIMNLLPDQMNLTQEQMDLLFSAVDEVQNSSPDFEDDKLEEKLVRTSEPSPASGSSETSYDQLPIASSTLESTGLLPSQELETSEKGPKMNDVKLPATKSDEVGVKQAADAEQTTFLPDKPASSLDEAGDRKAEEQLPCPSQSGSSSSSKVQCRQGASEQQSRSNSTMVSNVRNGTSTSLTMSVSGPLGTRGTTETSGFLTSDLQSSANVAPSMNLPEIPLPSCSLDLLNNDLTKTDMLSDSSSSTATPTASSGQEVRCKDYNAPWIVTVSMYWNDLPAVMMNNHPYVRLVDIHKQILPAKDTGILKKRCQLMSIPVENCSEMQRYFLVQYGRAFNSKSTLIISKDNAKDLIGYYVDPQPRTVKPYDHKSIIDHRREQLRRIALARRASVKAQKSADRDEDSQATKDIKMEPGESIVGASIQPGVGSSVVPGANLDGTGSRQRSTRHKKINFLELLRGDTGATGADDDGDEEDAEKKGGKSAVRKRKCTEKKLKQEYAVETDSNGETTETNDSEFGSSDETNPDSGSEIVVVTKPLKYHVPQESRLKQKSKQLMKHLKGQAKRSTINIKSLTGANKVKNKSKSVGRSTLLNVKVVGRSSEARSANESVVFRNWSQSQERFTPDSGRSNPNVAIEFTSDTSPTLQLGAVVRQNNTVPLSEVMCRNQADELANDTWSGGMCLPSSSKFLPDEDIADNVHKISDTPPEDILETYSTKEMETNTDFDTSESAFKYRNSDRSPESNGVEGCEGSTDSVDTILENTVDSEAADITKEQSVSDVDWRSHLPGAVNIPVMRRKEIIKVNSDEISLRIVHRDERQLGESSVRSRSQIGEVFVDRYVNKKSLCIRCYTCRKLMTVDNFSRHLHDVVSGGLIKVDEPRTIYSLESDSSRDDKLWNIFQHKKELFENNRIPSPADGASEAMFFLNPESVNSLESMEAAVASEAKPAGPRVINTPITPPKKQKNLQVIRKGPDTHRTGMSSTSVLKPGRGVVTETVEGTRSSSRKRKMKQLYPFEEYSFAKFPRLQQHSHEETNTSTTEHRD